jgi:alkyl sulfatase BDS1-like metallo-beta-lactamase superfamily hydrolase
MSGTICRSLAVLAVSAACMGCGPALAQNNAATRSAALPPAMDTSDPTKGLSVIHLAPGLRYVLGKNVSSNTFVLDTSAGAVVIDTSRPPASRAHHDLLVADGVKKVAYIVITHGHGDHTGGVPLWRTGGAKLVTQKNFPEFLEYQRMLAPFFARRNGAQFQFAEGGGQVGQGSKPINAAARAAFLASDALKPDITFDDHLTLKVGDRTLELYSTPGETPDMLTVWDPKLKAAFVGDNFYESFPNMYTLRGTRPRWPLDYIHSIEKVMALQPEILAPSHGPAIVGHDKVMAALKKYHDAIVYVHDAVLKGMNEGKSVQTLMQEIKLPPELDVGEGYGKISWTVRGIYEGYVGWFDGDPADMFPKGRESISASLVKLAGGPRKIADEAMALLKSGKAVEALQMTSIGMEGAPGDKDVLKARVAVLTELSAKSDNRNEAGWLNQGLAEAKKGLR